MADGQMIPEQRRQVILQHLGRERVLSYRRMIELLGVSQMTARRDVAALAAEGRVQATPGGAALPTRVFAEPSRVDKAVTEQAAKSAIAAAAAQLVEDRMSIYLDAGTTVQAVRPFLEQRSGLTVVTNDLATVTAVADLPEVEVICVGGRFVRENQSTVGRLAALVIAELGLDIAFLSTSSWDVRHGITTPVEAKVEAKRAALAAATTTVLLADSTKFGSSARFRALRLDEFDLIVSDDRLGDADAASIRGTGAALQLAEVPED